MPCDSSYQNPTLEELNKIETSKLIIYVDEQLKLKTPKAIKDAAADVYGDGIDLDKITRMLCKKLSTLNDKQLKKIVYNAKDKTSRKLADWWEEHQAADKKRLKKELKDAKDKQARDKAIAKLTPRERDLLGL